MLRAAEVLTPRVVRAVADTYGEVLDPNDALIRPSRYADLQINVALALAKRLGKPPREVAAALTRSLDAADIADNLDASGPGFLNVTLRDEWISREADRVLIDARVGVPIERRQRIIIDYSAPNVAKEMHVGHLRTTVVGDSLARILEHLGHTVVRQNHIGDWGTPFGMLIEHLRDVGDDTVLLESDPNAFYQAARAEFDRSPEFAERSRRRVVALQGGDTQTLASWRRLIASSTVYFNRIYQTLGVTLTDDDLAGESTYNDMLSDVCDELTAKGLARMSDGALCVFPDGFVGRDGAPLPLIIRKSDGGFGYATTDLATIRHRAGTLHADRVLYVVGAPQQLHFQMVFAAARAAGWLPDDVDVTHLQIGSVLGTDGKMLKTRSGSPVRLMSLLTEAIERADSVVAANRPDLAESARADIARQVGIGAVKYADLSVAHDSEYTFDFDRMLALTGNTGPYLQYATARIRSLFRKAGLDPADVADPMVLTAPAERALALVLIDFGAVVSSVGRSLKPHRLCAYLFDVAQAFTSFYENCPVLSADDDTVRSSRLALSALTLQVLTSGLELLGIDAPSEM